MNLLKGMLLGACALALAGPAAAEAPKPAVHKAGASAYRPPRLQGDPENPRSWVDFTAPPGKDLTYRVVGLSSDDSDKGASKPTPIVRRATG